MNLDKVKILMIPPPGPSIAPKGFPADPFPQASPKVFLDAMHVRVKVFCDEQKCPVEEELDEDDARSWHFVAYGTNGGDQEEPLSVIRIVPFPHAPHPNGYEDPEEEPYLKLGRVATMANARGKGLSRKLTEEACRWLAERQHDLPSGWNGLLLAHAQVDVEPMYRKLGFVTDANLGRWDEVGIEHLGMWKRIELGRS